MTGGIVQEMLPIVALKNQFIYQHCCDIEGDH